MCPEFWVHISAKADKAIVSCLFFFIKASFEFSIVIHSILFFEKAFKKNLWTITEAEGIIVRDNKIKK